MDNTQNLESYIQPNEVNDNTLETIALTFSGGGFRAAGFGFGVLEYLYRLGLLENVVYMASASGGSILTMKYALTQSKYPKDQVFPIFKKDMLKVLSGCELLDASLKTLQDRNSFYKDNKPNLINSFAYQYNQYLYFDQTIGDLKTKRGHLQELCINCSDLTTGLPFRGIVFLKPDQYLVPHAKFGNSIIHLKENLLNKIKLSDIVAASSCFPVGFEPMILTKDFSYGDSCTSAFIKGNTNVNEMVTNYEDFKEIYDEREIALIDGGVTDNTAIDSLIKSDEDRELIMKSSKNSGINMYDFIMVNDVGSFNIQAPRFKTRRIYTLLGWLKLRHLISLFCVGLFIILYSYVSSFGQFVDGSSAHFRALIKSYLPQRIITDLSIIPWNNIFVNSIILFILFNYFILRQQLLLKTVIALIPKIKVLNLYSFNRLVDFILSTRIKYYGDMAEDRIKVGKSLLFDAFLNRIKKLNLEAINNNPRYSSRKKCNNLIDLSDSMKIYNQKKRENYNLNAQQKALLSEGLDKIHLIATSASKMPTTLWFENQYLEEDYLSKLIACGHFTTCHNLLEYFYKYPAVQKKYPKILQTLESDFQNFKTDPKFLVSNQLIATI